MAEFVHRHLEDLLPAFTELQKSEILDKDEVKTLIQKCRQFEYSVNKRSKRAKDFLQYADFLSDLLELIRLRRQATKSAKNIKDDIEKPLKSHAAHLFRICSERFKKVEYYQQEIKFLHDNNIFHILTKTFTRFLQLHGNNPRHHEQAGRWEFFENKSAENARVIFQFALRKFPTDIGLWVAFFEMEVAYVIMLTERRAKLTHTDAKFHEENQTLIALEDISDAVFEFKLVEIVLTQALEAVDDKNKLLMECYKAIDKYEDSAQKVVGMLESRDDDNVKDRLEEEEEDEVVEEDLSESDLIAAKVKEFLEKDESDRTDEEANEIMQLFDKTLEEVPPKDALSIWENLIDFSIAQFPISTVDKIFEKAFTNADDTVAAHIKVIRLNYIKSLKENDQKAVRNEFEALSTLPPTNVELYLRYIHFELSQTFKNIPLIEKTFNNLVARHGTESTEAWIGFARFLIENKPSNVQQIYRRAKVNLPSELQEEFLEKWSQLIRDSS